MGISIMAKVAARKISLVSPKVSSGRKVMGSFRIKYSVESPDTNEVFSHQAVEKSQKCRWENSLTPLLYLKGSNP